MIEKQERQYIELFDTYANHVLTAVSAAESRAQWRLLVIAVRTPSPTIAWQMTWLKSVHWTSSNSMALLAQIPL